MTKVKLGRQVEVENTERTFGSADKYTMVWMEDATGDVEEPFLFTDVEIQVARERARKNPEDIKRQSALWNLFT